MEQERIRPAVYRDGDRWIAALCGDGWQDSLEGYETKDEALAAAEQAAADWIADEAPCQ